MSLQLDIQNPANFSNIPCDENMLLWVDCALQDKLADATISLVLRIVDETESQSLNTQYRHKNAATNVLSFPFEMPEALPELATISPAENLIRHLGDLVLCAPIIEQEALQQGKTLMQHWAHMIVHGVLHLQGYDHVKTSQAEQMEALETAILAQLGLPDPYLINTVSQ
jgi:probable rRNA maturation factor